MKNNVTREQHKALGEFAIAAWKCAKSPGMLGRDSAMRAALGNQEAVPADGGFLVGAQVADVMLRRIYDGTSLAKLCTRIMITVGNRAVFPAIDEKSRATGSRFGGVSSAWGEEASTIATSKPKFRSMELNLGRLTAAIFTTEEMLLDAPQLGALMETVLTAEAAAQLDLTIISGSGEGQPLGITKSGGMIAVAKDLGQAAATVSTANIAAMFARLLPSSRRRAVWVVGTEVENLLWTLATGATGPVAQIFTAGDDTAPWGRLMGRPVIPCEFCPTIGTTGDIIFCDPASIVIGEKPPDVSLSIHVSFLTGEPCFRLMYRCDAQLALTTPITPFDGGATQSVAVALAARA